MNVIYFWYLVSENFENYYFLWSCVNFLLHFITNTNQTELHINESTSNTHMCMYKKVYKYDTHQLYKIFLLSVPVIKIFYCKHWF
jgi:hypothetical protein